MILDRWLRRCPAWLPYALGLLPLAWIIWLVLSGDIGADPVKAIERRLGKIALWLLMGGLAIRPLRPWLNLMRFRRAVGLLAFLYLCLHLLAWIWLDMALLLGQALADLAKRPYLTLGLLGFLLLLPLALTSNRLSIRGLGRNWQRLHRLVYPAVALGVVHYLMQMKIILAEGWLWALALAVLLLLRLPILARKPGSGGFARGGPG